MKELKEFLKLESASGIILMIVTVVALILSNSSLKPYYLDFLDTEFIVAFGEFELSKPLLLWINDGMMAIFFLLVGLELKREILTGHLREIKTVMLPIIGAVGGLVVPALIYVWFNFGNSTTIKGWAIPAATDIAFALGVLSLVGNRIPKSAKIFLLTLAILDDLAAILIIALFYTADVSLQALLFSIIALLILTCLNLAKIKSIVPYFLAGLLLWVCVLKSGVHATLAGVVIAMFIPLAKNNHGVSPLHYLEERLHPWVAYMILPVFAIANAGIDFKPMSLDNLWHPVTLGSGLGLFFGKQIGVFISCLIAIKLFKIALPEKLTLGGLYGISVLTGVGFTMSLFISSLAFGQGMYQEYMISARLGILLGSFLAAVIGYLIMRRVYK